MLGMCDDHIHHRVNEPHKTKNPVVAVLRALNRPASTVNERTVLFSCVLPGKCNACVYICMCIQHDLSLPLLYSGRHLSSINGAHCATHTPLLYPFLH